MSAVHTNCSCQTLNFLDERNTKGTQHKIHKTGCQTRATHYKIQISSSPAQVSGEFYSLASASGTMRVINLSALHANGAAQEAYTYLLALCCMRS